ncbi:MAG: type II secretion system protein GspL [Gammaproteobacteria bacterium]|nr:type II secretion system protein GspL [Gammaproteobacteria bacterium]
MAIRTCYIRWKGRATPEEFSWYIPAAGKEEALEGESTLEDLKPQLSGRRAVLVVPGRDLHLTTVTIPSRNRQKVMRAVPYALEDQLAEDVDQLHFVVEQARGEEGQGVAVVSHERMAQWLAPFSDAGIRLEAMVVDTLLLPFSTDRSTLLLEEGEDLLLRSGRYHGFSLPAAAALQLLESERAQGDSSQPTPLEIYDLRQRGGDDPFWRELFTSETVTLNEMHGQNLWQLPLQWQGSPNLLQGSYSRTEQLGKMLKPWRPVLLLALLWIGLMIGSDWLNLQRLQQEVAQLQQESRNLYLKAFPESQRVINPRAQMEQKLSKLRQQEGGASGFIPLFAPAITAVMAEPGVEVEGVRYRQQRLELYLRLEAIAGLERIQQRLEAEGKSATIESATSRGSEVEGRISVTEKQG